MPIILVALLTAFPALAQEDDSTTAEEEGARPDHVQPYRLTVRGSAGLGAGNLGLGWRGSLGAEAWFSSLFGLGGFWGALGQSPVVVPLASGTSTSLDAQFAGVTAAIRTAPRGTYGLFTVGVGYAWGQTTTQQSEGLCINFTGPVCPQPPPPTTTPFSAVLVDLSGSVLFHVDAVELGPGLHFEAGGVVMGTLDVQGGFAF